MTQFSFCLIPSSTEFQVRVESAYWRQSTLQSTLAEPQVKWLEWYHRTLCHNHWLTSPALLVLSDPGTSSDMTDTSPCRSAIIRSISGHLGAAKAWLSHLLQITGQHAKETMAECQPASDFMVSLNLSNFLCSFINSMMVLDFTWQYSLDWNYWALLVV